MIRKGLVCFGGLMLLTMAAPAGAQSVHGRVLDGATDEAIAGAEVRLHDAAGRVIGRTLSDAQGRFFLLAPSPGEFALGARLVGYAAMEPVPLRLDAEELVEVEVRLAVVAVQLEPLTVTGRRPDVHQDATFEGALARHGRFPGIGSRRVILRDDVELRSAIRVSDTFTRFVPPRRCLILYWNGTLALSPEAVSGWLESSAAHLDALEFYRSYHDAPLDFRGVPPYVLDPTGCSVIALWLDQVPDPRRRWNALKFVGVVAVALLLFVVVAR